MATESKYDYEQLILRLERNHQCVLHLSRNLSSYIYEPKDYECFKKLGALKASFSELANGQRVLFDKIQHQALTFGMAAQKVQESIEHYHELEKDMAKYLLEL